MSTNRTPRDAGFVLLLGTIYMFNLTVTQALVEARMCASAAALHALGQTVAGSASVLYCSAS